MPTVCLFHMADDALLQWLHDVQQQVLEACMHCRVMPTSLWAAHLSISTATFLLKETSDSKNNLLGPHAFYYNFE